MTTTVLQNGQWVEMTSEEIRNLPIPTFTFTHYKGYTIVLNNWEQNPDREPRLNAVIAGEMSGFAPEYSVTTHEADNSALCRYLERHSDALDKIIEEFRKAGNIQRT